MFKAAYVPVRSWGGGPGGLMGGDGGRQGEGGLAGPQRDLTVFKTIFSSLLLEKYCYESFTGKLCCTLKSFFNVDCCRLVLDGIFLTIEVQSVKLRLVYGLQILFINNNNNKWSIFYSD